MLGASGFIGRQVLYALRGHKSVSSIICGGRSNRLPGTEDWIFEDFFKVSSAFLSEFISLNKIDVVISCLGVVRGSFENFAEGNTLFTAKLIDAVLDSGRDCRVVRLGSAAEFGVATHGVPFTEDSLANPVTAYGITQLASTQLLSSSKISSVVLRLFNPIGPGLNSENMLGHAIAAMRSSGLGAESTISMGPLDSFRDFVDVRDAAEAVVLASFVDKMNHDVLNIGSGVSTQSRDLVKALADSAGFKGEIVERLPASDRSSSVDWVCADISLAEKVLNWKPRFNYQQSVFDAWNFSEEM